MNKGVDGFRVVNAPVYIGSGDTEISGFLELALCGKI